MPVKEKHRSSKRSHASSASHAPSGHPAPWGEWLLSPTYDERGSYYRARQSAAGGWEYEFRKTPPDQDDLNALAGDVENLGLNDPGPDDAEPDQPSSPEYTTEPRKGKRVADPEPYEGYEAGYSSDTPTVRSLAEGGEDDPDMQQAIQNSRQSGRQGQASGSRSYGQDPAYGLPEGSPYGGDPAYGLSEQPAYGAPGQPAYDDPEQSAYGFPEEPAYGLPNDEAPVVEDPGYMQGNPQDHEALDDRYRVYRTRNWVPGTVFKIYWSEPMGANGALSVSDKQVYNPGFGQQFYTGFRRFIIIATDEGHSTCVPVSTYGNQGCRKNGVKASRHGLIYGYNTKPRKDTEDLGFPPVRVKFTAEGEKLSSASRVNYSKLMTIEHNCRVFLIGRIPHKDFEHVQDAVNACWSGKKHFPPGYMESQH